MKYILFWLLASTIAILNAPAAAIAQTQRSPQPKQGKLEGQIRKVPQPDSSQSDAPLSIQQAEQAVLNFQLVTKLEGYEFYIDPSTIITQNPFVRFWSYVVLPPDSKRIAVANAYTAVDCGARIVKIYEIINYSHSGEIVSANSFSFNDQRPSFGVVNHEFVKAVCPGG
ncbi:hypothetical protein Pse7367_0974 [Thalassoporum mexicanum PCC 7367]|uniref:surface-adhesin E family protein n=1 Tax=Thalassoporum mexicanum TaxID=3457544 RepID=UPI00029FB755|nr:surface-adhesin E family protein [Pseudanabaena sp. PCC 7367]AFY69273.1 hypothetical protein Pse7367_0974 [Pseudanabaena sp. PCC 7367]